MTKTWWPCWWNNRHYWGIFCYHPPTWRQRRHLKATYTYTLYGIETHRCTQSLLQSVQPMDLPKSGNHAPAIFMVFTAGLKCWEGYQAHGNLAQCSQKRLVIDFIWYFLQFFLWLQTSPGYFVSSYDKYYENLTKISFWACCSWEQIFKIGIFEVVSGFRIFKQNRDNPNEIGMVGHSATVLIFHSLMWDQTSYQM